TVRPDRLRRVARQKRRPMVLEHELALRRAGHTNSSILGPNAARTLEQIRAGVRIAINTIPAETDFFSETVYLVEESDRGIREGHDRADVEAVEIRPHGLRGPLRQAL